MTNRLKPCPFCGSKAKVLCEYDRYWAVFCTNDECIATNFEGGYINKENAIKAWNHRVKVNTEIKAKKLKTNTQKNTL